VKVKVKVHPNSSKEKIVKVSDKELEVWIKEKPVNGKANAYIKKFLKKELGVKCEVVGLTKETYKTTKRDLKFVEYLAYEVLYSRGKLK